MMRGKRLLTTFAALMVAAALIIGPIPGLMNVPSAHAEKGESYLSVIAFDDNRPATLLWLPIIGVVQPFMFWFDLYNDAYY
ncbi:hypothetical protein MYX64_07925 [Nitrospinae bacterium AH_259_B05_G02_I21]|nr:hypothetical protein [Nitrospinae bacterium AH_259_B05_G02_I21]MDA2931860.1 hypothetical protein [Nitrospinae bacterium AH-259-F20]